MSTALKLSGVALRRLRGTKSVTTCSGLRRKREFPRDDILKAFGDEFDNIQRVQGQYLTKSERREKEAREAAEAKAKREEEERLEGERKAEMEKRAAEEEAARIREEEEAKRKDREEEDARTAAEREKRIQKLRMEEERVKRELELELSHEGVPAGGEFSTWNTRPVTPEWRAAQVLCDEPGEPSPFGRGFKPIPVVANRPFEFSPAVFSSGSFRSSVNDLSCPRPH
ncbi:hypothetical protein CC2G_014554 [Coprinopsis cinerea AmutBmut pab1-1]|nr:hypothetical protein CC2G_014554 [Coprinopsis cinerea AmutBmut pab1-1]